MADTMIGGKKVVLVRTTTVIETVSVQRTVVEYIDCNGRVLETEHPGEIRWSHEQTNIMNHHKA